MERMNDLWRDVGLPGTAPAIDPRRVKTWVNAALDADLGERKIYMKQKLRMALLLAAAVAAITGSALAASGNWDMLSAFFKGDTSPAQEYVNHTAYSVSDENYIFTVESAVSDNSSVYMVASVTALSEEAKAFLPDKFFVCMDTWNVQTVEQNAYYLENPRTSHTPANIPVISSIGGGDLPSAQENTRRFTLHANVKGSIPAALLVRLGYMGEDAILEIPVTPAPSVTLEPNATGLGIPESDSFDATPITVSRITLSPFTCVVECSDVYTNYQMFSYPNLFFRMTDGSVRTLTQLTRHNGGHILGKSWEDEEGSSHAAWQFNYRFYKVQDLENIVSILLFGTEYPLDGSEPFPAAHDPRLEPFELPAIGDPAEDAILALPVRELAETLGGVCEWEPDTGNVKCIYRGVSVTLRPGEDTAWIDGEPFSMKETPKVQDGLTISYPGVFCDAWGVDIQLRHWNASTGDGDYELVVDSWQVIP